MGVDATIYCRIKAGEVHLPFCDLQAIGYELDEDCSWPNGATHEVNMDCERLYCKGYERGNWPRIARVLLELVGHPSVEAVWYGGDNGGNLPKIDEDRVIELCRHWMRHRNQPYRNPDYRIKEDA